MNQQRCKNMRKYIAWMFPQKTPQEQKDIYKMAKKRIKRNIRERKAG